MKRYNDVFDYRPVLIDALDDTFTAGTLVRKVQPPMTPENGTMNHCYVQDIATDDPESFSLVCLNSLVKVGCVSPDLYDRDTQLFSIALNRTAEGMRDHDNYVGPFDGDTDALGLPIPYEVKP